METQLTAVRPQPGTSARHPGFSEPGALRVPEIAVLFWVVKALSTAMGEATSDSLVARLHPAPAVALGFVGFVVALVVQFRQRRYRAWAYWSAVVMVGVFGTMAADVLHVGFGVPYLSSTIVFGLALAVIFVTWKRREQTLSIHTIDTTRRERFYWAAVVATFALGTAAGDLTATTFHLGYGWSFVLFAAVMLVPVFGYVFADWNAVLCFWFAYVVTRPLGASFADWMGKPTTRGGLGVGAGTVSLILTAGIVVLVGYLAVSRRDVQAPHREVELEG